jgi:hypothetical protein
MTILRLPLASLLFCAAGLFTACGGSEELAGSPTSLPAPPESFWSASAPESSQGVTEGVARAASGDAVALRGTLQDFVGGLAAFTMVEDALDHCAEMGEDDHCPTPWDYCCADPDALRAGTVTVELRDGEGMPGAWQVQGFHGLDRLSEIFVEGTLERDSAGNPLIVASRISEAL